MVKPKMLKDGTKGFWIGPYLFRFVKAGDGKWTFNNKDGEPVQIVFGILVERKPDAVAKSFAIGAWRLDIGYNVNQCQ